MLENMSDGTETPNQNSQAQDPPSSATTTMAESEPSPPQSETTSTTSCALPEKFSNLSFSIWPPSERTRDAVRNRLIETLSSPSILSKKYGIVTREIAVEAAKVIEEEAFEVAGKEVTPDDDGIEILQVYSKEISKRMLDKVKARSGEMEAPSAAEKTAPVNDESNKPGEEDAGSTAPPQSEKTESVADDE